MEETTPRPSPDCPTPYASTKGTPRDMMIEGSGSEGHPRITLLEDRLRNTIIENELLRLRLEDALHSLQQEKSLPELMPPPPCPHCEALTLRLQGLEAVLHSATVRDLQDQLVLQTQKAMHAQADAEAAHHVVHALNVVATHAEWQTKSIALGWGTRFAELRRQHERSPPSLPQTPGPHRGGAMRCGGISPPAAEPLRPIRRYSLSPPPAPPRRVISPPPRYPPRTHRKV